MMHTLAKPRWRSTFAACALAALAACIACALAASPAHAAAKPSSITAANVSTGKLVLVKGKSYQIGAAANPAGASQKLKYKSSKKRAATVSSKGKVRAKRTGQTTITVTSKAKKSVKKKITVRVVKKSAYKKAKSITVTGARSITPGASLQLKGTISPAKASNKNLRWKTSNDSVATVDAKGRVTAKRAGTVAITCWSAAEKKVKKTVTITVTAPASAAPAPAAPSAPAAPAPTVVKQGTCGTSAWTVDSSGLLTIKPANGVISTLAKEPIVNSQDSATQGMPWCDKSVEGLVKSITIFPGVHNPDPSYMFEYCTNLETIDLSGLSIANATNLSCMFIGCEALKSITFSNAFDTSKAEDMSGMFEWCRSLQSLTLPASFDTSKVTNMGYMFDSCNALKTISSAESFNTGRVTNMQAMFRYCHELHLDCGGWNVSNVTNHYQFKEEASFYIISPWAMG